MFRLSTMSKAVEPKLLDCKRLKTDDLLTQDAFETSLELSVDSPLDAVSRDIFDAPIEGGGESILTGPEDNLRYESIELVQSILRAYHWLQEHSSPKQTKSPSYTRLQGIFSNLAYELAVAQDPWDSEDPELCPELWETDSDETASDVDLDDADIDSLLKGTEVTSYRLDSDSTSNVAKRATTFVTTHSTGNVVPGQFDVILGRGSGYHFHPGNIRLRELIEARVDEHTNCQTQNDKVNLTLELVKEVQSEGGRFLQRTATDWTVVTDQKARQKVSHTFRNIRNAANRKKAKQKKWMRGKRSNDAHSSRKLA